MGIQEPKDVWVVLTKIVETKFFFRQMLIQNKLTNHKMDKATSNGRLSCQQQRSVKLVGWF
jgi:hypothetical protein